MSPHRFHLTRPTNSINFAFSTDRISTSLHRRWLLILITSLGLASCPRAFGQEGSPLPGAGGYAPPAAPANSSQSAGLGMVPTAVPSAPVPGRLPASSGSPMGSGKKNLAYGDLPLNAGDAKAKIIELENLAAVTRPQDVQERVYQLCEWLGDMADAHNKMANVFAHHDSMKAQSAAERQAAQRFSQLRNQAQLIKADLLINMHRYPEALSPLIEIVSAEPTSATGQSAYKRLKDIGFAQDPDLNAATADVAEVKPVSSAAKSSASGGKPSASATKGKVGSISKKTVISR